MKVAVLGAGGFLGAHIVVKLLDAGHSVCAGVRPGSALSFDSSLATIDPGDLHDSSYVRRLVDEAEAVVFSAGRTWHPELELAAYERDNVGITQVLLDAFATHPDRRLVYTSSMSTICGSRDVVVFTENTGRDAVCEHRLNPYDTAKIKSENLLLDYARRGGNAIVLNPAVLLGPAAIPTAKASTPFLVLGACRGECPLFVESQLSFCDVRDVAVAHVTALTRGGSGERYILAGHNLTWSEFYLRLAKFAGVKRPARIPNIALTALAMTTDVISWATGGRFRSPIPRRFAQSQSLHYCADSQKAIDQLDYSITPFERTLLDTLRDYVDREELPDTFNFLKSIPAEDPSLVLCFRELARTHRRKRFLLPRLPRLLRIARDNRDLNKALEKILDCSRFDSRTGRFCLDRRGCRDELKILHGFFDYLYFSSNEFLAEVL
jgi:dihydroflavonol-4-reductase